jgi:thioredoxin
VTQPIQLTSANFVETVDQNTKLIVRFTAPWCGPCKTFAPVFDKAAEETSGMTFAVLDVDDNQDIATEFGIRGVPSVVFFKDGEVAYRMMGAMTPTQFQTGIEKAFAPKSVS